MARDLQTWTQLSNQRREASFVGRTEELHVFQENFRGQVPQWMVLSVIGLVDEPVQLRVRGFNHFGLLCRQWAHRRLGHHSKAVEDFTEGMKAGKPVNSPGSNQSTEGD